MQLENSFAVSAPPERVFAYLLDVNKVVGCVPGAQLSEVVDPTTFKGNVKIKVGPVTVTYNGTARISERDDAGHTATLTAEGRETTGPGSARATAQMRVHTAGEGSTVEIVTEYHVTGRVAQFGRSVIPDVSRRLVQEMARCIQANLEASGNPIEDSVAPAAADASTAPATPAPQAAREINVFALLAHLISVRVRRLFGRRSA